VEHIGEIKMKHYDIKLQIGTDGINWFHDLISETRIELQEDEYIILEECKEANYINDLDKEASLQWICAVIERCTIDIRVAPIEKLLDILFDIERNERD
tara:strand:- start:154 stop:450 length:297 start_codon:yes stop_codon:yes gene_type:complete